MNQHWHWQAWQGYSYLTCDLLSHWQHSFFTQEFYPRTPEDLTSIWRSPTTAYRVKQIHGNVVLTPQEITNLVNQQDDLQELASADAVISDRPQQSVWAASADCTPVLIGDLVTGQVCAIHAGWRGTAQKIVPQAIARFIDFGSKKSALRIAIGPAISGKMYQVDEKVAIEVGQTVILDAKSEDEKTILAKLKQFKHAPVLEDDLPGKVRLDVPRVNHLQLEQLGINPEQIAIAPYCTFEQDKHFFSYRRTGEKKVQWSGIVSH
jgi:polyphenol oxidase